MIAGVSIVLAAYELLALLTGRPTVTHLSHTRVGLFVWLWLVALAVHLVRGDSAPPVALLPSARRFAVAFAPRRSR